MGYFYGTSTTQRFSENDILHTLLFNFSLFLGQMKKSRCFPVHNLPPIWDIVFDVLVYSVIMTKKITVADSSTATVIFTYRHQERTSR